jgi:hypothetical protein
MRLTRAISLGLLFEVPRLAPHEEPGRFLVNLVEQVRPMASVR